MVGRTPGSAADALVGLFAPLYADGGTGASRADQGVRPTNQVGRRKRLPHQASMGQARVTV